MSHRKSLLALALMLCLSFPLGGCPSSGGGAGPRIDLEQVNEAFLLNTGATFGDWINNFETKVNEIYFGKSLVSVSVLRPALNALVIYGYIEKNNVVGYQADDKLLFRIVQDQGPGRFYYRIEDGMGWVYKRSSYGGYSGFYSFMFVPVWIPYRTPASRYVVIRTYRTTYRKSPAYATRRTRFASYRSSTRAARRSYRSSRSSAGKSGRGYRGSGKSSGRASGGKW